MIKISSNTLKTIYTVFCFYFGYSQQYTATTDLGLSISESSIVISENSRPTVPVSKQVMVRLDAAPQNNVEVTVSFSDYTEFSVSPQALTFTPNNWNTQQTFTFTAIDDDTQDGDQTVSVSFVASSTVHDSGTGDGSHDSGTGDGSHDSGTGDGSHDSGTGDGSHDSGTGDGSHDSGTGDGSHDSGTGDGSHDSGTGDGSHDSGTGDGSHDSGTGDGSHDSGTGDGSHDSGTGDGTTDVSQTVLLSVRILDYNTAPEDINDIEVKVGFHAVGYPLATGISDPEGDSLSLIQSTPLTNGTVSLVNGELLYTPNDKYFGPDALVFRISDGIFETTPTTVSISVIGLADVNADGSVTTTDLVYLASHLVEIDGYTMPNTFENVFDVNQDGEIGATDIVYLASHLVGIDGYDLNIN